MSERAGVNRGKHFQGSSSSGLTQVLASLAITLFSVAMLLGSFWLSWLDTVSVRRSNSPVSEISPTSISFFTLTPSPLPSTTPSPSPSPMLTTPLPPDETVAPTAQSPSPTRPSSLVVNCEIPPGWQLHTVAWGETLYSLAVRSGSTVLALVEGNCLRSSTVYVGQEIYLPTQVIATRTPEPCGPPRDWVEYTVQAGDTLSSLSRRFGVSIRQIRQANCMSGYVLYTGTVIFLPVPPPPTATYTPESSTPTPTPGVTPTPSLTHSPTPTGFPTATWTPTPVTTSSTTPTQYPTFTPTVTSSPTHTLTPSSPSPSPTPFSTHTPTPFHTLTRTPTLTPSPSATPTPTAFHTFTPTSTPELSPSFTPTSAPTVTFTPTPTVGSGS